jgi:hypothetical protein
MKQQVFLVRPGGSLTIEFLPQGRSFVFEPSPFLVPGPPTVLDELFRFGTVGLELGLQLGQFLLEQSDLAVALGLSGAEPLDLVRQSLTLGLMGDALGVVLGRWLSTATRLEAVSLQLVFEAAEHRHETGDLLAEGIPLALPVIGVLLPFPSRLGTLGIENGLGGVQLTEKAIDLLLVQFLGGSQPGEFLFELRALDLERVQFGHLGLEVGDCSGGDDRLRLELGPGVGQFPLVSAEFGLEVFQLVAEPTDLGEQALPLVGPLRLFDAGLSVSGLQLVAEVGDQPLLLDLVASEAFQLVEQALTFGVSSGGVGLANLLPRGSLGGELGLDGFEFPGEASQFVA